MIGILAPLVEKALGGLFSWIDQTVEDKDKANELKAKARSQLHEQLTQQLEAQKSILLAELGGESPAQRNWRPHLMYMLMGLILFYGVVIPIMGAFGVQVQIKDVWEATPEQLWTLLQIGMGGYIGGRTLEKVAKTVAPALRRPAE